MYRMDRSYFDRLFLSLVIFSLSIVVAVALACRSLAEAPLMSGDRAFTLTRSGASIFVPDAQLPAQVVLDADTLEWRWATGAAIAYVNDTVGREVLTLFPGRSAIITERFGGDGCFGTTQRCAYTHTRAVNGTGEILLSTIYLPDAPDLAAHPRAWWLLAHELGHALGLDDDGNDVRSLMSETLDLRGDFPPFTSEDASRLIEQYGRPR